MAYWLDLLGSYIIGGVIILMIVGLNIYISNSAGENNASNIMQQNLSTTADIIDHDFYKIGYRVTGDKIVIADSTQIKFYTDIDNNGTSDSLNYYTGPVSTLSSTRNPNDRLLYRIFNDQSAVSSMAVTAFRLSYYDSLGAEISYADLTSQSYRNIIKSIQVYLKVESSVPIDDEYQGAEWQKKITPKNL